MTLPGTVFDTGSDFSVGLLLIMTPMISIVTELIFTISASVLGRRARSPWPVTVLGWGPPLLSSPPLPEICWRYTNRSYILKSHESVRPNINVKICTAIQHFLRLFGSSPAWALSLDLSGGLCLPDPVTRPIWKISASIPI